MVWKLKAKFLRRAITHEDRVRTISHLEKRGHSDTLSHGVGGLENMCNNARRCQIGFRHGGRRTITKNLHGRKTVWDVRHGNGSSEGSARHVQDKQQHLAVHLESLSEKQQ